MEVTPARKKTSSATFFPKHFGKISWSCFAPESLQTGVCNAVGKQQLTNMHVMLVKNT